MRSAGFPCRFKGCEICFRVVDQTSMPSLHAASLSRTDHEFHAHGYVHVSTPTPTWAPYHLRPKPKSS